MDVSKLVKIVGLLIVMGFSGLVSAHDLQGTLGVKATATDKWYFQCLNPNTAKVLFRIRRTAGTPCVKASYIATGQNATSCGSWVPIRALDPTKNFYIDKITIPTGPGAKFFAVNKNPAISGTNSYTVNVFCIDNTGMMNPADLTSPQVYTQNQ